MKTVKRVSSDWDIYADTVTINGNLVVVGQTTSVESVDTLVYDNFITLAAGQGGGPTLDAGIEVDRGSSPKVGIRWHESEQRWQYTNDGSLWKSFSLTRVEDDLDPHLGGNLIVNDYAITSDANHDVVIMAGTGGNVVIGPSIRLPQINSDPAPQAGYSTIYAKATEAGDTGFFVSNEKVTGRELISKRKAFIYSVIF
jgi:hypothetical protein